MFSQENLNKLEELKKRFPDTKSLTIPTLWLAQEQYGWISEETMKEVARLLNIPVHHVYGVTTFYTMFNKKPVGKYHLQVCTNVSCQLLGSEKLIDHLCSKLNVKIGGTTTDGKFTISEVECLGACGIAPTMQVNDEYYENLTVEKVDNLLTELK